MILSETPRRKRVTKLVSWGHWFTLFNILVAIVFSSVYLISSPLPNTLLGTVYMFANWFSHMAFLVFFAFVICVLPGCYLINSVRWVKGLAAVIAAVGQALLAFDALLYNRTGLHLSFSSADILAYETSGQQTAFGWQQGLFLMLLFLVWLSGQLIVANALWKRIERLQRYKLGLPISSFFVICFVFSHAVHVWADANLYQPIVKQDNMLPLSYPATAKTTMSRYGLLDIEDYNQRKRLQFDPSLGSTLYPAEPVYCSINNQRRVVLLIQTQGDSVADGHDFDLRTVPRHYNFSSDLQSAVVSTLYGLPELYSESLRSHAPVLLDLPNALGLTVSVYADYDIGHPQISPYQQDWDSFRQKLQGEGGVLAIGFVNAQQMQSLVNEDLLTRHQVIMTRFNADATNAAQPLFSNVELKDVLSSNEDIAPTLLNLLGCAADTNNYATGQNLLSPRREWLVSTLGDKLMVLHDGKRIEVMSNGSHEIFDLNTGQKSGDPLNVQLLSRATNHLSRFSGKR